MLLYISLEILVRIEAIGSESLRLGGSLYGPMCNTLMN